MAETMIKAIPNSLNLAVVTNDFPVFNLNRELLLPDFLNWLSKTADFVDICRLASEGTTNRVRLKEDKFLSTEIRLPPIAEQRRIVARIEELAAKIEEARGLRESAIEECKILQKNAARNFFAGLLNSFFKPLRDVVQIQGGGTPSKSNPFFWGGDIPWISPKDMKARAIRDSIDCITDKAVEETSVRLIEPNSILIVVRGMILAHTVPLAVLEVPATINQDMKALVPSAEITAEYLCAVLWGLNDSLLSLVTKSTHDTRKLETNKLLNFKIPVPPISQQRQIVQDLDHFQLQINNMKCLRENALKEFDALLPAILDKAFKGEL